MRGSLLGTVHVLHRYAGLTLKWFRPGVKRTVHERLWTPRSGPNLMSSFDFRATFQSLTGKDPFPWQQSLFDQFDCGIFPSSLNLPTGLGKSNVIAVWMTALLKRSEAMPRRLVYVVNRRTVVDQTTDEVEKLRANLSTFPGAPEPLRQLAISTLRGQFADNREWSADPSRPAVICGTVDLIGSRLLFSGYGIGFKAKPLHAGFLGQDSLLVHDEAHLEPAFQHLLLAIEREQQKHEHSGQLPWPKLRVMELTATSRTTNWEGGQVRSFTLTESDRANAVVMKRVEAKKALSLHENEGAESLAELIAKQALKFKSSGRAVLVFVCGLEDVEKVSRKLPDDSTERLTGTLRGLERDGLVKTPVFQRFLPESNRDKAVIPAEGTVYLVCTSAGEVGVNISADHLVCDLSTFESMAQRFGRVNRFGDRDDTEVHVIHPASFGKDGKLTELDLRRQRTLGLLDLVGGDASPAALDALNADARQAAFTPPPTILPATDILFDAWALTTIRDQLPGRPPVEPFLHGISEWQPPETHVAWRDEVEVVTNDLISRHQPRNLPEDLLDEYPLKPQELLRDRSDRVFKHLMKLAEVHSAEPVWVLNSQGQVVVKTLRQLIDEGKNTINSVTLLLPPRIGGLKNGSLDGDSDTANDVSDRWFQDKEQTIRRRIRLWDDEPVPPGMRWVRTIDTRPDSEESSPVEDKRKRYWHWFELPRSGDSDGSRAAREPIRWQHHTDDVTANTRRIVQALNLPVDLQNALILAAELHDLGKKRDVWQRGIGNPNPTDWHAKSGTARTTGGPWKQRELCPYYRHEFGSLLDVLDPTQPHLAEVNRLDEQGRDLVLHLIAAHHGFARPHFPTGNAFDPERDDQVCTELAIEIPRRFARLQRKYGRWGLAYLESLLRAADWAASASPSMPSSVREERS